MKKNTWIQPDFEVETFVPNNYIALCSLTIEPLNNLTGYVIVDTNNNGWDAASPCSFAHTSGWNEGKHRSALQPLDNDAAAELSVSEIPDHGKSLHGQMKTV